MPLLFLGSALCRFQVFSLLLIVPFTTVTTASAADDSTTRCEAEAEFEESRREHPEAGAVLLQLKSAGNSAVAGRSELPAEQLEQYAELKQTLAQSKESAQIMTSIDQALDGRHDSAAALANDVQTLDDVLKMQDSLPTQAADAAIFAQPENHVNLELSLLEQSATHAKIAQEGDVEVKSDTVNKIASEVANADAVNEVDAVPVADTDGNISVVASTNSTSEGGQLEVAEVAHTHQADYDEGDIQLDTNELKPYRRPYAAPADEEEGDIQSDLEADDDDADSEEEEEDDEAARTNKLEKLSMLSMRDAQEVGRESLNEDGYLDVVSRRSNKKMELFVERLCLDMGFVIIDIGGLKGMVPYYSGRKATQKFEKLQEELRSAAGPDGWLTKHKRKKGGLLTKKAEVVSRHPHHHHHRRAKDADTADATNASQVHMSLLGIASTRVVRAAHKVPDVALALFGSRNMFMVITIALAACLFCLDERKRTGRNTNYEDVLNMSPEPPPHKEDPAVAASLKVLRGGAGRLLGREK